MGTHSSQYETLFRQALAKTLRAERAEADLTYIQLEAKSGISRSSLLRFEKGTRDPSIVYLFRLASGLGVTPAHLVAEVDRRLAILLVREDDVQRLAETLADEAEE